MSISVSSLLIYPIKSLGPVSLESVKIGAFGPHMDRRFMLVDESGKFYTQRQDARLSQFNVELHPEGLKVIAPDGEGCGIGFADIAVKQSLAVRVWDDAVIACVLPAGVDAWFSRKLDKNLRLVFIPDDAQRQVDLQYARAGDVTSFNDGFPALLLSEESVTALQTEVGFELSPVRFRPNILISGCEAFAEDGWREIKIGDLLFDVVKPCSRCVIPTIDPASGIKQSAVMDVLVKLRKKDNKVYLGQNLIQRGQGIIRTGDKVEIIG